MRDEKIKVDFKINDDIEAFGAYESPSITKDGKGSVLINVEAHLVCALENDIPFKEIIIETMMHEFGHVLEEHFNLNFDEERIDKIIDFYREKYQK